MTDRSVPSAGQPENKQPKDESTRKSRLYTLLKNVFSSPLRFLLNIHVEGQDKQPTEETGGVIICCNHTHLLDVIVLGVAFDRQLRFMAKKELFSIPLLRGLITKLGAFGIDRGGTDVDALKKAIALAAGGEVVAIFPQGTRYPGKEPIETSFKSGAVMAAYHARVPILPVFIGVKGRRFRPFCRKTVVVGDAIPWEAFGFGSESRPDYANAAALVKDRICRLDPIGQKKPLIS